MMPTNPFLKKIVPSSNSLAALVLPLTTGVALATTAMFAAPAKAIPVIIDSFTTATSPITVTGTGSNTTVPAVSIGGTDLTGATRKLDISATQGTGAPNQTTSVDINSGTPSGIVSLSVPSGYAGTATLSYANFGPTDVVTSPQPNNRLQFDIDYDFASVAAPITFTITANGSSTQTIVFNSGGGDVVPLPFLFSGFTDPSAFNSLTSLVVSITSARGNDVTIRSPIRAVPVPPAVVGTLLAAGLAAVKVAKKKKPVQAESSEA